MEDIGTEKRDKLKKEILKFKSIDESRINEVVEIVDTLSNLLVDMYLYEKSDPEIRDNLL